MKEEIRLGQCWMAQLSKRDLCVRLESRNPGGGWIARAMSHGRMVKIRSEAQLLYRCGKNEIHAVAETTKPNRRSLAVSPPKAESVPRKPLPKKEKVIVETVIPPKSLSALSLLDAAAMVLQESQSALSTREIIALVVERKLWVPTGATPWGTLNAALNREIQENGMLSRFQKKERGKYSLREKAA